MTSSTSSRRACLSGSSSTIAFLNAKTCNNSLFDVSESIDNRLRESFGFISNLTLAVTASCPNETFQIHSKPQPGSDAVARVDTHPGLLCCQRQRYGGCTPNSPPNEEAWMNFYTHQHKHYCGIDLHARVRRAA